MAPMRIPMLLGYEPVPDLESDVSAITLAQEDQQCGLKSSARREADV